MQASRLVPYRRPSLPSAYHIILLQSVQKLIAPRRGSWYVARSLFDSYKRLSSLTTFYQIFNNLVAPRELWCVLHTGVYCTLCSFFC